MKVREQEVADKKLGGILKKARTEDILVTKGKSAVLIHALDEDELFDYLFETDPRFARIIEEQREECRKAGKGIPLEKLMDEAGIQKKKPKRQN